MPKRRVRQLSFLRPLRQGVSPRRAGSGLDAMPCQRRSARRGRPVLRGHREVRGGPLVGRTDGGIANEKLSAAAGPAGLPAETGREAEAAGDSHDPRPRGANRRIAGLGTDLRGRPATRTIRLP